MSQQGVCKLCGQTTTLRLSHIVPAFAVRWLKETSATGFLKSLKSKARVQETKRVYLLCDDCEQILGNDEKTFCEKLFIPYHENNQNEFEYGPWLRRFIVGQHWKVLVTREDKYLPEIETIYAKAEADWQRFLLNKTESPGTGKFHLFLADVIEDATGELPEKMNWYLSRGFDFTPLFSENGMAGVYAMIAQTVTFSYLTPPKDDKTAGTQVGETGVIKKPQSIGANIGSFIFDRAKLIEKLPKTLTPRQIEKVAERARRDPDNFARLPSVRLAEADAELKARLRTRMQRETMRMDIKGRDRNSPCPCGSGKKVKKCHGR